MKKQSEDLQTVLRRLVPSNGPNQYILPTAIGAGVGGVGGGLLAPKGKMLRGLLRGAALGGSAGLGLGATQTVMDNSGGEFGMEFTPLGRTALPAAGALTGLAGGLFANRVADELEPETNDKSRKHKKHQNVANEKQSKVYEASEAVDGMHVKHTKMNHKKCTPGEFGAMVKEAGSPWARMGKMVGSFMQTPNQAAQKAMLAARREFKPSAGGNAPPKTLLNPSQTASYNRTFNALKRQGVDQDTAAFHASQAGQLHIPRRDALQAVGQDAVRAQLMHQGKTLGVGALGGAGVAGAYGYGPLALPQQAPELEVKARKPQVPSMTKTQSARDFGAYVKRSFNISQHLPAAGVGAAAGAGLGALGGLINPGEEDEYDDQGRVVGRKQRSRFGAMLNNALMGAGVGGVAGGVGSAVVPGVADYSNQALQKLYGMFQQRQPQETGPNVYPANTTDYAALDADPNSQLNIPATSRVGMPQGSVPNPTAAEIPDLDAAGVQ
jgi:hypothetical protein